jgi:hypothetical protein
VHVLLHVPTTKCSAFNALEVVSAERRSFFKPPARLAALLPCPTSIRINVSQEIVDVIRPASRYRSHIPAPLRKRLERSSAFSVPQTGGRQQWHADRRYVGACLTAKASTRSSRLSLSGLLRSHPERTPWKETSAP